MKNIVLYAPPAAGKGTLCELLEKNFGYKTLSIGQVMRNARSTETEIGRIIIETQDKGILAPDKIVAELLKEELKKYDGCSLIVDGYPRNINQAILLDEILDDYLVINLNICREDAKKRTLGRRNCVKCNKIYNVFYDNMKPKTENLCDICNVELNTRSDDNEESFNARYDVYENNAPEILKFYRNKGILRTIDSNNSSNHIYLEVAKIIKGI